MAIRKTGSATGEVTGVEQERGREPIGDRFRSRSGSRRQQPDPAWTPLDEDELTAENDEQTAL